MTRIDIYHAGEEPDQHIVRVTPGVSCTTTVREVPTKLKSDPCSWDEVLTLSDVQPAVIPGCLILPPTSHLEARMCDLTK
jgi:hypothetical protein